VGLNFFEHRNANMYMRVAVFFLSLWALFPLCPPAGADAPAPALLRDDAAGYVLPLPAGWQEITDPRILEDIVRRVCVVLVPDGGSLRAAALPSDKIAAPALVVFTLKYATLGLDTDALQKISKDSEAVTATLANAMQEAYKQAFPQSIMINSHLGDDFFSLNLRTVLDFADEKGTTRNRHLKLMLALDGVLVLMTLYDGPQVEAYDVAIAASVREMRILPDKLLQKINPPFEASFLDYLLLILSIISVVYIIKRMRRAVRS
jgi:hypothetical protein